VQVNSTAWRQYSADAGGVAASGTWDFHVAGGSQEYYQTFSAVAGGAARTSERLTTEQWTPTDFASASGQFARPIGRHNLVVGAEFDHTESTVDEYRYALVNNINTRSGPFVSGGTARNGGVYTRLGLAATDVLSISIGLRGDWWKTDPVSAADPVKDSSFFSPRFGVRYRMGDFSIQAAAYRAYRSPTLNEMYRGFRVGNTQTNPNSQLDPEKLTGGEGGVLYSRRNMSFRVTAFANTLEGAVANVTIGTQGTTIIRERRNSDEIRATGLELEATLHPHPAISINGQTTFTSSHYRGSVATPALEGNRVPQVPEVQFGAEVTWAAPQQFTVAMQTRGSSNQFDDDLNTPSFLLDGYGVFDLLVSRPIIRGLHGFFAVENITDKDYDTGRTPLRTIGWPRTYRVGIRVAVP
jgi:outer membrane receptor protein involved in Fe transport